jgi:hypothetical protein
VKAVLQSATGGTFSLSTSKSLRNSQIAMCGLSMETSVKTVRAAGRFYKVAGNDRKTMGISWYEDATLFNCPVQTSVGRLGRDLRLENFPSYIVYSTHRHLQLQKVYLTSHINALRNTYE